MMFRSKPVQLTSGALLLPVYDERTWQSYMLRSTDGGATWDLGAAITTPSGNIHPCVVELSDGTLLALLRTGGAGGQIWRAASADEGRTWSAIAPTAFPNPNAGIDLLRLQDGRLLLAFNNSQTERVPLDLAWSDDEGATWSAPRTVVARPAGDQERTVNWQSYWGTAGQPVAARPPEFSYPTLLQTRDGTIHLVYTHNRTSIRHLPLDATQLDGVIPQE
jgi:predicted neuraminidase